MEFEWTIVNLATYRQYTNAAWDWMIKKTKKKKQINDNNNNKQIIIIKKILIIIIIMPHWYLSYTVPCCFLSY